MCLYSAWPFYTRGVQSVINRSLNMFTLIGLGVSVAYAYSVIGTLLPGLFPASFRGETGGVAVYFEAAGVIVTLILLGQVMELRARSQTGAAIKQLLGLAAKTARRIDGTATSRTCRWSRSWSATACAYAPAKRYRSTASSSKATARSTSRW